MTDGAIPDTVCVHCGRPLRLHVGLLCPTPSPHQFKPTDPPAYDPEEDV
jgi:hypothetical protein